MLNNWKNLQHNIVDLQVCFSSFRCCLQTCGSWDLPYFDTVICGWKARNLRLVHRHIFPQMKLKLEAGGFRDKSKYEWRELHETVTYFKDIDCSKANYHHQLFFCKIFKDFQTLAGRAAKVSLFPNIIRKDSLWAWSFTSDCPFCHQLFCVHTKGNQSRLSAALIPLLSARCSSCPSAHTCFAHEKELQAVRWHCN